MQLQNQSYADRIYAGLIVLRRERPEVAAAFDDALGAAFAACPDGLLELCRTRIRTLLGAEVDAIDSRGRTVADYASSEQFDETERLTLEFAEQYVLDVANTPDSLVAALRDRLGPAGLYALVMGIYTVDQLERLALSAAIGPAVGR